MTAFCAAWRSSRSINTLKRAIWKRRLKSSVELMPCISASLRKQDHVGEIGDEVFALGVAGDLRRQAGADFLFGDRKVALAESSTPFTLATHRIRRRRAQRTAEASKGSIRPRVTQQRSSARDAGMNANKGGHMGSY